MLVLCQCANCDVFSRAANQLPNDFEPSQSISHLPDDDLVYVQEEGLGMRVSSEIGASRSEAERMRLEPQQEKDVVEGTQQPEFQQDFQRVPSDRAKRLSERLADPTVPPQSQHVEVDTARPISRKQSADSHPPVIATAAIQRAPVEDRPPSPISCKAEEKPVGIEEPVRTTAKELTATAERRSPQANRTQPESRGSIETSSTPVKKPGIPLLTSRHTADVIPIKSRGPQKSAAVKAAPASVSSVPASNHGDRTPVKTPGTHQTHSKPVTKEISQDRVHRESSRLLTARSNISTASSNSAHPSRSHTSAASFAHRRISAVPSENTPRSNVPYSHTANNNTGEVAAERSRPEVGDKTARPQTSVVEQMNTKILEHALGVNPKLKSSPLARTARFGSSAKSRGRATSPRPNERATTAVSVAASEFQSKDVTFGEAAKTRPPWNPSTLDTLYSPRKPDTSPPKSRDNSPNKGQRETTPGRDAVQVGASAVSTVSASAVSTASALSSASALSIRTERSSLHPPRSRGGETASTGGTSKSTDARASCKSDKAHISGFLGPALVSAPLAPSLSHPPASEVTSVHGLPTSEANSGIDQESANASTCGAGLECQTRFDGEGSERVQGEGAGPDIQPLGNEFLIPPEFQNLDRPLTRRDERPNNRNGDGPSTRGGLDDFPGKRPGPDDRPDTRGLESRLHSRSVSQPQSRA